MAPPPQFDVVVIAASAGGIPALQTVLSSLPADFGVPLCIVHLVVNPDLTLDFMDGRKIRFVLSSANPLFTSAARVLGRRTIGVVLSGSASDGTDGVQAIKRPGGVVIAQDRRTAEHFGMPGSAISTGAVDYVLPLERIGPALVDLVYGSAMPALAGAPANPGREL